MWPWQSHLHRRGVQLERSCRETQCIRPPYSWCDPRFPEVAIGGDTRERVWHLGLLKKEHARKAPFLTRCVVHGTAGTLRSLTVVTLDVPPGAISNSTLLVSLCSHYCFTSKFRCVGPLAWLFVHCSVWRSVLYKLQVTSGAPVGIAEGSDCKSDPSCSIAKCLVI